MSTGKNPHLSSSCQHKSKMTTTTRPQAMTGCPSSGEESFRAHGADMDIYLTKNKDFVCFFAPNYFCRSNPPS